MTVKLPKDYRPSEDEEFMNPVMREYFRLKLLQWKADLQRESGETLQHLQEVSLQEPDIADRASLETDRSLELRTRDRRSEEHTSELQSLMLISYAVFCLKKKKSEENN